MTSHTQDLAVRPVTESEIPDWIRALNTGFLRTPYVPDDEIADRSSYIDPSRTLGAFDGTRCVATFRSFPQELTAVGGNPVPADAISNVTVTVTHRRRGLLTRMMAQDLAAAKERGDVVATLIAAEYPIYGRYGFGPATSATQWEIDVTRAGLTPAGPPRRTAAVSTWWTARTYASSAPNCTSDCAARSQARSTVTTAGGRSTRVSYV